MSYITMTRVHASLAMIVSVAWTRALVLFEVYSTAQDFVAFREIPSSNVNV